MAAFAVLVVALVAIYNVYTNQNKTALAELVLENVEALADSRESTDPNVSYGSKPTKCFDNRGKEIGTYCDSVQWHDECHYNSLWGDCNK